MSGLFSNPLNWAITDYVQGQPGGDPTPGFNLGITNAVKSSTPTFGVQDGSVRVGSSAPTGNAVASVGVSNAGNVQSVNDGYPGFNSSTAYGTGIGTGSGTSATAAEEDYTRAQLDAKINALRQQLGLIDTTRQQGLDELGTTYKNQKNTGLTKYGTQRDDNAQSRLNALEQVDTKARTGMQSLRRLLGMSGSANQSAAKFAAPNAVSRQASMDRQSQIETYGRNDRNINTAESDFLTQLDAEKKSREKTFLQGLLDQSNSLNAQLGEANMQKSYVNGSNYNQIRAQYAPYQQTIDANNAALAGLQNTYKTPLQATAATPTLDQYAVDQTAIDANKQSGQQDYSPYSQFLLKKRLTGTA